MSRWPAPTEGPPEPSRDDVIAATEPTRAEVEAAMLALALTAHEQQRRPICKAVRSKSDIVDATRDRLVLAAPDRCGGTSR